MPKVEQDLLKVILCVSTLWLQGGEADFLEEPLDTSHLPWLHVTAAPTANWFPNFDCIKDEEAELVYDLIAAIPATVGYQSKTGSASVSGHSSNEEIWSHYTESLNAVSSLFKVSCPFGFLAVRIAKWLTCTLGAEHPACRAKKVWIGSELASIANSMNLPEGLAFLILANTRWVWLCHELWRASCVAADDGMLKVEADILSLVREFDTCDEKGVDSGWPWAGMRDDFENRELELSMNNRAAEDLQAKIPECPMGSLAVVLGRIYTLSASLTEDLESLASLLISTLTVLDSMMVQMTDARLDPMLVMAHSKWSVVLLWGLTTQRLSWKKGDKFTEHYQHKPFVSDFWDEELVKPDKQVLLHRLSLSHEEMQKALRLDLHRTHSPIHRFMTFALRAVQKMTKEDSGPNRMVLLAMVFGTRIARFMPGYMERAEGFNLLRKFIFSCQDKASYSICSENHKYPDLCVQGTIASAYSKYTAMTAILHAGFGVLYLDFDVIFMQDPLPYIFKRAEEAEIVISRDFGSRCINTGVTYLKAHPDSVDFMERLLIWLWHHPYEFCQKAFAGLLGVEDLTRNSLHGKPFVKIPRWKMLDHVNQFVTSTIYDKNAQGWTGELENIVIYHFLDGLGGVDENVAIGAYKNLNALFFDNPTLNLTDVATPLWEQDPLVKEQLEWSRQPNPIPEEELLHCVLYEYDAWPVWKRTQLVDALKVWADAVS